jgi:hypothetical protein
MNKIHRFLKIEDEKDVAICKQSLEICGDWLWGKKDQPLLKIIGAIWPC